MSKVANANENSTTEQRLIVLDELPHLHSPEAQTRGADLLARHIQTTQVPTCWIYSDSTTEPGSSKVACPDLERWIPASILYQENMVQIITIHAPTKPRFNKAVQTIVTAERRSNQRVNLEELYARCQGDVRFAITTLQFELVDTQTLTPTATTVTTTVTQQHRRPPKQTQTQAPPTQPLRDTKLTSFHALGKLLYAKRRPPDTTVTALVSQNSANHHHHHREQHHLFEHRPPLEFDPDRVVEQSDMELSNVLSFLGYHSPDFFTDLTDLSRCLDFLSDAAVLLDTSSEMTSSSNNNNYNSSSSNNNSYNSRWNAAAVALAGRAVACSNRHAAPTRFRQLTAPAVYRVMRQRRDNQQRLRTAMLTRSQPHHPQLYSAATYATEVWPWLPYMGQSRTVTLASHFDAAIAATRRDDHNSSNNNDDEDEVALREQQEILQFDDIVEDD